ncbi:hypothetical protein AAMO2058_000596500 [Amorphochlora amoebiformis]
MGAIVLGTLLVAPPRPDGYSKTTSSQKTCRGPFVTHLKAARKPRVRLSRQNRSTLICVDCTKQFDRLSHLLRHASRHAHDTKTYDCPEAGCKAKFRYQGRLYRHLRIHKRREDRDKALICTICSTRLSSPSSLKTHMLRHTGEKPYKCSMCDAKRSTKGSLRRHVLAVHQVTDQDLLGGEAGMRGRRFRSATSLYCNHCERYFGCLQDITRHMLSLRRTIGRHTYGPEHVNTSLNFEG